MIEGDDNGVGAGGGTGQALQSTEEGGSVVAMV